MHWIHYKNTKTPQHFTIIPIYFYCSNELNDNALKFLTDFCSKKKIELQHIKIPEQDSRSTLFSTYASYCSKLNCNKLAIVDCLDDLDSILLSNMAVHGTSDIPNVIQQVNPSVSIIRPFAYISKSEIDDFGQQNSFPNEKTGPIIPPDPSIEIAKQALYHMADGNCNALLNVFHSLFDVRHLYIGVGDGSTDDTNFDQIDDI